MNDQIKQKLIEDIDNKVAGLTNIQIMQIADIINSQPLADQWIPCSERLPDKGGTYIVTQERYRLYDRLYKKPVAIETAFAEFNFMDDVWNRARHLKVTAWMPAEPYKGEEK